MKQINHAQQNYSTKTVVAPQPLAHLVSSVTAYRPLRSDWDDLNLLEDANLVHFYIIKLLHFLRLSHINSRQTF